MMQIISTTDGKYVGLIFDPDIPLVLNGVVFAIEHKIQLDPTTIVLSNSNYVLIAKEI